MATWSEMSFSEARGRNRLDAEYFTPTCLSLDAALDRRHTDALTSIAFVTDGIHASPQIANEGGVRYLSAKCVKDNDFVLGDTLFITQEQNAANRRTQLQSRDILITTVGTIGNAAVVQPQHLPANADRHLGIVRLKRESGCDPFYVASFLNSRYGRFQTIREATGNVQLNLFIEKIKMLRIPRLSCGPAIAQLARRAYSKRADSERFYAAAESMLNEALGLADLDLTPRLFYEGRFTDASAAARFDAEYFSPAKYEVLDALARMAGRPIGEQFRSIRQLWQPERAPPSDCVRNYDLTDALSLFLDDSVECTTADRIGSTKKVFVSGDLVISRLRSYLKEIAVVLPSGDIPLVGSSEFIVLRPNLEALSVEALLVYLRSPYVQTILKWSQDGSNHPRFDERALLSVPIPDRVLGTQDQLAAKVKEGIAARREARACLERAKHTVEIAIEQSEAAAITYLGQHCQA